MSAVNWADEEGRHEQIWTEPDHDLPDLADVIDIHGRPLDNIPTTTWGPAEDERRRALGCPVRDDGRMCPMGLFIDEHHLIDGTWAHPDEAERWRR